jgi:adenylate cyclase
MVATVDIYDAKEKIRLGDLDGAIELARPTIDNWFCSVGSRSIGLSSVGHQATTALVEALLARGTETDRAEAKAAIDRLAAVPTEPGFVLHELPLLRLRALQARAHGDDTAYRDYRDRYHDVARTMASRDT